MAALDVDIVRDRIAETTRLQTQAAKPDASAWVSANAGTGKTFVLVRRVLRLLLAGAEPEKILCLTYTKAAASEMANRLFAELAKWAVMPEDKLRQTLSEIEGRPPTSQALKRARTLFATTLETPGSLKVQTIHAFCERLLARFPLEAGIAPNATLLDEMAARELKIEAIDKVLLKAARNPETRLGRALLRVVPLAQQDRFYEIMFEAIAKKQQLRAMIRSAPSSRDPMAGVEAVVCASLGIPPGTQHEAVLAEMAGLVTDGELSDAVNILSASQGKRDRQLAEKLRKALYAADHRERVLALQDVFLTKDGKTRSTSAFINKPVRTSNPALCARLDRAKDEFARLNQLEMAVRVAANTQAVLRLADQVIGRYEDLKAARAALDFDDLIEHTVDLLANPGEAQWVLYKLDQGFDHILIDEAQDTSPLQWKLVELLAEEFFTGEGASEAMTRTVFAVGDEKQSIYSFQGAAPELFSRMGEEMAALNGRVGGTFHDVPLTLSFRTTPAVLQAVDKVFADPDKVPGVIFGGKRLHHASSREGEAGLVEIWPVVSPEPREMADAFDPLADLAGADDPITQVANRIAGTIRNWLDEGEILTSQNRPVRAGDILILVRKRNPFVQPMIRALKAKNIPVAGADRMRLSEQIAVQDLVALGAFLLLNDDDLALAAVLKSPLFGFDDQALYDIAHGRGQTSLWRALWKRVHNPETEPASEQMIEAVHWLQRWSKRTDAVAPYELYAGILDQDGMRQRLIARLGLEAADAIDEFMALALSHEQNGAPSLQNFLQQVRHTGLEIKRDMDQGRDEVRIMTVHGAKGLEAEIVFLPDTCSTRGASGRTAFLTVPPGPEQPPNAPEALIWTAQKAGRVAVVETALEARRQAERQEYYRLLYVAMTRARERLYVCGFDGRRNRDKGCWYDVIREALQDDCEKVEIDGETVLRFTSPQSAPLPPPPRLVDPPAPSSLPDWLQTPVVPPAKAVITLTPSALVPPELAESRHEVPPLPETDQQDQQEEALALSRDERRLRGILTHALLEHLPPLPAASRPVAAKRLLAAEAAELPETVREEIAAEVLALLENPDFARFFGPGSVAEVPIIFAHETKGRRLHIPGVIDRLLICEESIDIIDFKTNREVPDERDAIPQAYILQLAAYRLGISRLYPGKSVRCGLLWTKNQRLTWLDAAQLAELAPRLEQIGQQLLLAEKAN